MGLQLWHMLGCRRRSYATCDDVTVCNSVCLSPLFGRTPGGDEVMRHRRQATPVVALLARLGWQRDAVRWTIPCRDDRGRGGRVRVGLAPDGVRLTSAAGSCDLTPLQVGRLRGALADAVIAFACLHADDRPAARATRHAA